VNWSLERDLLKSAMIQYPEVFKDCPNAISRLVRMQHYTLPTRLYDVTSNPLVALYFACCTEFDKDGIVLYTKSDVGLTSLAEIDILADLVELLDESEKSVKNMFDYLRVNDRVPVCSNEQSLEKFLFKRITESLLFQPPMDNERIKRQQGAFVFSALMKPFYGFKDYRPLKRDLENKDRLSDSMKDLAFSKCREVDLRGLFEAKYFYIKSENKIQLLRELDLVGINEAYVYPEVEHRMKTIKFKNLPKNSEMLI